MRLRPMAIIFCGWFSMSISKGNGTVLFYLALLLSIGNVRRMLKVSLSDRTSFGSL
jgi:hypothetical protein